MDILLHMPQTKCPAPETTGVHRSSHETIGIARRHEPVLQHIWCRNPKLADLSDCLVDPGGSWWFFYWTSLDIHRLPLVPCFWNAVLAIEGEPGSEMFWIYRSKCTASEIAGTLVGVCLTCWDNQATVCMKISKSSNLDTSLNILERRIAKFHDAFASNCTPLVANQLEHPPLVEAPVPSCWKIQELWRWINQKPLGQASHIQNMNQFVPWISMNC